LTAWDYSEAPIRPSARKHGVEDEDIRHALRNCIRATNGNDEVALFLGPDRASRLIEVGGRRDEDGYRVVHAMRPARLHLF
jgi:hypothetical protein